MSRIRSVHPGLWTDERFVSLSIPARLLFIGLWNECDDQGSFAWSPITIKMRLAPIDAIEVPALLSEMVEAGVVIRYEQDGRSYGAVRNFCRFQRPNKPNSTYPQTPEVQEYVGSGSRSTGGGSQPVGDLFGSGSVKSGQRERIGEEGKGEERTGGDEDARGRATALPEDFTPVLTDRARETVSRWTEGVYERELEQFRDHHRAKGSRMKDWQAAFRTWITNAEKFRGDRNAGRFGDGKQSGWK